VTRFRIIFGLLAVLLASMALLACGGDDEEGGAGAGEGDTAAVENGNEPIEPIDGARGTTITVGSKNFTEQFILGEIYAQALEAAGFTVEKELNLGSEQIAYRALRRGQIDAYPEYTGTALTSFFDVSLEDVPKDQQEAYEQARDQFQEQGITALAPTPFENTYRLGMLREKAEEIEATTISDLKDEAGNLSITGYPECRQRTDCLIGVQREYEMEFQRFVASESTYEVLDQDQADVGFVFTTDGPLATGKYQVLDDDQSFFPPYNITFNVRDEAMEQIGDEGRQMIERIQEPLTEEVMQELNSRVDIDKQQPRQVAAAYLRESGFVQE
jgi:glycine betaine/choline ABC-type transport system substrate-binding protein